MSDGLWWRKVKRGIIRDDRLEQVAYSLPANLRSMVISWYMVAYMLADDDGVFDFEDGGIFALRTFSSIEDVNTVREQMEKRNVIQNVLGGKSSIYLLNDWIDVQDGSQYNIRSSQTAEERRARVARKIEQEQKAKVESSNEAANVRKNINQIRKNRKTYNAVEPEEAPQEVESVIQDLPAEVYANRASDFFNFEPLNDSSTKSGDMSKHTQDRTVQDNTIQDSTIQYSTAEDSTAKDNTDKYAAAAADMPPAVADGYINDIEQCTKRPTEAVNNSHYDAILSTLLDFFDKKLANLNENERGNELVNIKIIADRLFAYQSQRNSGAAIVSVYISAVKKSKQYSEAILPSQLLESALWSYTDAKLNAILTIKPNKSTKTPKDST